MITFNTQEEFDAAVMAAVEKYLSVKVVVQKEYYSNNQAVEVSLRNSVKDEHFPSDFYSDSDTVCVENK